MRRVLLILLTTVLIAACGSDAGEPTAAPETTSPAETNETPTTTTPAETTTTQKDRKAYATTTVAPPADDGLASGLFCRDLYPEGYTYAEAVAYWDLEGRPDRMDADLDGVPCETVYPEDEVLAFWGITKPEPTDAYAVGFPHYTPDPLPSSDGAYGSGCSPGGDVLPDGVWFGFVAAVGPTSIEFDLACYRPGDGKEDGLNISNDNPKLRTVPVAADAVGWRIFMSGGSSSWDPMTYSAFISTPADPALCPPEGCPGAWIYVNGGEITELVELFLA